MLNLDRLTAKEFYLTFMTLYRLNLLKPLFGPLMVNSVTRRVRRISIGRELENSIEIRQEKQSRVATVEIRVEGKCTVAYTRDIDLWPRIRETSTATWTSTEGTLWKKA